MRKAIKKIAMLFMVCGLAVSVSFGAWVSEEDEAMYQKLKSEVEEMSMNKYNADVNESECFKEDGSPTYKEFGGERKNRKRAIICRYKNVLAFVDEYRANKGKGGIYTYNEVERIPRFKEDSSIYGWGSIESLLKEALKKWEEYKIKLEMFYY